MSPLLKKKNGITDDKYLLRKYCMMSAIFSLGIMCVIFFFHDNTLLFGDKTVLRMDLYHQYCPLYAEVYDRIISGGSIVYSWTSGLGGNFIGNFFNYCSSPFALIMFLFGHKNMPEAIAVMIMLKAVFASVAFTYYVNKSNGNVRKESVIFGLFYAFSAYFVAYSWNIMWLDAFACFPLVILGIERIIQYNKPLTYIVAMTYTMISNYYMAYMVCILSVMYFIYFYFGRYELSAKIFKPAKSSEVSTDTTLNSADECVDNAANSECIDSTEAFASSDAEHKVSDSETKTSYSEISDNIVESESVENATSNSDLSVGDNKYTKATVWTDITEEDNSYTEAIKNNTSTDSEATIKKHKFKDNRFWVTGWTFALSSFLCFCFAAFALIPIAYCLQSSSATGGSFPEDSKQYFDIFTFIANHLPGIEPTIRSSGNNVIPNVYCGLITVMLLPLYFLSSRIPGKQKVVSAVLLMACLIGFALNYFNFIWHGFHMPNDLPYRWSFAYSFFLLIIAYKAFQVLEEFSNKAYIGIGFAVMCFVVLVEKFDIPNADELTILLSVIFAVLYVVIFGMLRSPKYKRNAIVSLLFFTVVLEIVVADAPKIVMQQSKSAYTSDYYNYQELSEKVEAEDNELFFRTELGKLRARMDPSWYGYNGISTFSSMAYEHTAKMIRKLGVFGNNINSYTYYPQTPVFNSMFNIKYIYDNMNFIETNSFSNESVLTPEVEASASINTENTSEITAFTSETTSIITSDSSVDHSLNALTENVSDQTVQMIPSLDDLIVDDEDKVVEPIPGDNNIDLYTNKDSNEDFEAFEYNYYLPLIFSVDRNVINWDYSASNPFEVQNALVDSTTGITDVFVPVDATAFETENIKNVSLSTINSTNSFSVSKTTNGKKGTATVKLVPEQVGNYYIYVGGSSLQSLNITVGELTYNYVTSSISPFILDVGYLDQNDEIIVKYNVAEANNTASLTFKAAVLNAEKFKESYKKISDNGTITLDSFEETSLSGKISVNNENALLWTSIPYDEGWEIYVDGKLMTYTVVNEETEAIEKDGDIVKVGGGLIGIKVEPGEHTVEFKFKAAGLSTGLMITLLGVVAAALIVIYKLWLYKFFEKIGFIPVFFRKTDYHNN